MSRSLASRLSAHTRLHPRASSTLPQSLLSSRCFSQSSPRTDRDSQQKATESFMSNIFGSPSPRASGPRDAPNQGDAIAKLSQNLIFDKINKAPTGPSGRPAKKERVVRDDDLEPYHLHVYAHKHNTHITCTRPNREPIISMSTGNIGFKKSRRGLFDAGYSLAKYVVERLVHQGWPPKINRLELVFKGFGQGREAIIKLLMSPDGRILRDRLVRVADATVIKYAGTRSEKPRRV